MDVRDVLTVFRACGGAISLHPDGLGFKVEGDEKIWPLGKELIDRTDETLEALRAGEPASAGELISAWKALPESEKAAFREFGLASFDDFAHAESKRLIQSAVYRGGCPQPVEAQTLIAAWNEVTPEVHAEFPDGVVDFEIWSDEVSERLIKSATELPTHRSGEKKEAR